MIFGIFFSLTAMVCFYGACFLPVLLDLRGTGSVKRFFQNRVRLAVTAALFAASTVFTYWLVSQNRFVYYWDYSGYWMISVNKMRDIFSNGFRSVYDLYCSINNDDYNQVLPTVIALPLWLFGQSFPRFVVLNHILFLLPAAVLQSLCACKYLEKQTLRERLFPFFLLLALLVPANSYAMLKGYIDIAAMLPCCGLMYLLADMELVRFTPLRNGITALLMIAAWLSRRYIVYFIIGYVAAMALRAVVQLWQNHTPGAFGAVLRNFAMMGGISLGVLAVVFPVFIRRVLFSDYGEMYSVYDAPLPQKTAAALRYQGWAMMLLLAAVVVLCLVRRKALLRCGMLVLMPVVECAAFFMVQKMGVQHVMILTLPCFLLLTTGVELVWDSGLSLSLKRTAVGALATFQLLNFTHSFVPPVRNIVPDTPWLAAAYYPLVRNDLPELQALTHRLNELTEGTDKKIYLLASDGKLNYSILWNMELPEKTKAVPNLLYTHDVDLRDGFPPQFLTADYLLLKEPFAQGQQEMNFWLSAQVSDSANPLGRNYAELERLPLGDGCEAVLYQRTAPLDKEAGEYISAHFDAVYPTHPELFRAVVEAALAG